MRKKLFHFYEIHWGTKFKLKILSFWLNICDFNHIVPLHFNNKKKEKKIKDQNIQRSYHIISIFFVCLPYRQCVDI